MLDDGDQSAENVRIIIDNISLDQSFKATSGTHTFEVNSALLQSDGLLSVNLRVTMALMGLGLVGMGAAAYRRK